VQITDEIRWFFPGLIPGAVVDWFRDGAPIAPAPKRTDIYLPLPSNLALGIKLREERLEIKTRASLPRAVSYSQGIAGHAARWKKESYRTQLSAELERRLADPSALHVVKERHLRKFSLQDGSVAEISTGEFPALGCLFEITQLWLDDRPSWTLALEAFGTSEALEGALDRTASHLFEAGPCPAPLDAETCADFPDWLPAQRPAAAAGL
jgi:hypothetical protein